MLLMFSRGFKDIVAKTAFFKEFPGLENKFQNSRGFKEIKDPYEPCEKVHYFRFSAKMTDAISKFDVRRLNVGVLLIKILLHCALLGLVFLVLGRSR